MSVKMTTAFDLFVKIYCGKWTGNVMNSNRWKYRFGYIYEVILNANLYDIQIVHG